MESNGISLGVFAVF